MSELKDNLKQPIIYVGLRCCSILEVLKESYRDFKIGYGEIKPLYREQYLVTDLEDDNCNYSLYSCVYKQIEQINRMLDGE